MLVISFILMEQIENQFTEVYCINNYNLEVYVNRNGCAKYMDKVSFV